MNKKSLKIIAIVLIALITIFALIKTGTLEKLTNIAELQLWFEELGIMGYCMYILLYIAVAVFMLPASVLTIAGGIVFGSVQGGILALFGSTIGASVAFIIAKYLARDIIVEKMGDNPLFKKIEDGVKRDGSSFLILTRLVPIFPYNVQNYAYGLTSMKISTFTIVSLITMTPGAFIYAFMAGEIATNGVSTKLLIQFTVAGTILFLVSLIPKIIAKKKGIVLDIET